MGMLGRMQNNALERMEDFAQQTERYQQGEIGLGDQMFQGAANAVGLFGDVAGEVITTAADVVLPEFVQEGLRAVGRGIMDTETAQAALNYLDENPDVAKRIGYATDLADLAIPGAAKSSLRQASLEWSNRQPWFYGSGKAGQGASVAVTGPQTALNVVNPKAAASRREGTPMALRQAAKPISEERIKKYDELKAKTDKTEEDVDFIRKFNSDLSFLEGQLDQTQLISTQRGSGTKGIVKQFENIQAEAIGKLDSETMKTAFQKSKPLEANGIDVQMPVMDRMVDRIKAAQKIAPDEDVIMIVRNPTAFSDVAKESLRGPSKEATAMYNARDSIRKYYPDKTEFSQDELVEFAAMSKLADRSLVRASTGEAASKLDKYIYKLTESSKYKPKEDSSVASKNIKDYYRYKSMVETGKKLTKPQKEKFSRLAARVESIKEKMDVQDGRVYFQGSHKSAAKGLGGVNDQFMVDAKGNFVHVLNDENDLFGFVAPGDKRIVSVAVPNGYNVFNANPKKPKSAKDTRKQDYQAKLQETTGAAPRSATPQGLLTQTAQAINKTPIPRTKPQDYAPAAVGGLITGAASRDESKRPDRMLGRRSSRQAPRGPLRNR